MSVLTCRKTLIAAAICATVSIDYAAAGTACTFSAQRMRESCMNEAREEAKEVIARCEIIADAGARNECRQDARDERSEAPEECGDLLEARLEACDALAERRYADPLLDQEIEFIDPDEIGPVYDSNPYVMLQSGHTHVLHAGDEIVVVHATDEVRDIQGVPCRVVVDIAVEEEFDEEEQEIEYTEVEITDDWFAQDIDGNVYYCGEVSRNFEDEVLRDLDGSFESGVELAGGGLLIPASPVLGEVHRQEYALGEAEDIVEYLEIDTSPGDDEGGENEAFPCDGGCLKTFEFTPLEPESTEYKYYLPGTGFVLAVSLEDGEIDEEDREELVCNGDSLGVLHNEACGIEDPGELLEELCEMHDELCADDDEDEGE